MPKRQKKKARGRPTKKKNQYPPRVDATPEEAARAMFALPVDHEWEYTKAGPEGPVYRCADCEREIHYPDTLYRDGRCKACHSAVAV